MSPPPDQPPQVWFAAPNRSLGPLGRQACLAAVAAATLAVAAGAAALGAWPVLPFAGLEVAFVAFAFRAVARHDGDFERIEIEGARVRLQARRAARLVELEGHAPWARLVVKDGPGGIELGLRYAGRTVGFGRLLTDGRRREWAAELGRRLPVTRY
jgi:uncharacterized membrane protein